MLLVDDHQLSTSSQSWVQYQKEISKIINSNKHQISIRLMDSTNSRLNSSSLQLSFPISSEHQDQSIPYLNDVVITKKKRTTKYRNAYDSFNRRKYEENKYAQPSLYGFRYIPTRPRTKYIAKSDLHDIAVQKTSSVETIVPALEIRSEMGPLDLVSVSKLGISFQQCRSRYDGVVIINDTGKKALMGSSRSEQEVQKITFNRTSNNRELTLWKDPRTNEETNYNRELILWEAPSAKKQ